MPKRSRGRHERRNSVGLMLRGVSPKPICYFHAVTSFTSMPTFPPEIIADVLSRLPVKSLLRLRCVSHLWRALIDSPHFIKTHLSRSIQTNTNTAVVIGEKGTLHSLDLDSIDQATPITVPFKYYNSFAFLATCDGLILVHCATSCTNLFSGPIRTLALFNPSTRKYQVLPASDVLYPNCGPVTVLDDYGFAYDAINDDYNVLRVLEFRDWNYKCIDSEARVYSLKSNSWSRIPSCAYRYTDRKIWARQVKNAVHTIGTKGFIREGNRVIVAFNAGTKEFSVVPKMEKCYTDVSVDVLEGLFTIGPPVVGAYRILSPLAYSRCRGEVLLNFNDKKLIWYDLRRKSVRDAPVRRLPGICCAEVYVKSLVSLDGCGKVEGKKQQGQVQTEEKKNKKKKRKLLEFLLSAHAHKKMMSLCYLVSQMI
ncbi:hypothetical protein RJ639_045246 [Escallonia herrerae]|uniref:F-box domain-containing protein n=1 Tax=Escallonia herrerae TaxID=1293975 RepID=A0AA89B0A7_9ASTE|nr:hypothetical protein RJ639_045246 [Escallonia herrerae]